AVPEYAAARLHDDELVTKGREIATRRRGDQRFDLHVTSREGALREPAGLERLLDVQTVVDDVRDELGMGLRLIEPAHDAEPDPDVAFLQERGNDRVQRPLPRSDGVRMVLVQRKKPAPVVQGEAAAMWHEATSEVVVEA